MVTLSTKTLSKSVLNSVKRTRPIYNVGRRARLAVGSGLGARYVPALESKAHYNDVMLPSTSRPDVERYRRSAIEFVDILGGALAQSGRSWADIWSCLDVGCGYGRIVRELCHKLPSHAISVCDLSEEGVRFTASEFGVRKVPIVEMMGPNRNGTFDLIYILSLYTHIDRPMIEMNLAKVAALTRSEGLVVFTTHGKPSAETAERFGEYWLDKAKLNADLDRTGFYYERYPYYYSEYGMTWIVADEMKALVGEIAPELDFVAHHPMIYDGDEDVFVYRKR